MMKIIENGSVENSDFFLYPEYDLDLVPKFNPFSLRSDPKYKYIS